MLIHYSTIISDSEGLQLFACISLRRPFTKQILLEPELSEGVTSEEENRIEVAPSHASSLSVTNTEPGDCSLNMSWTCQPIVIHLTFECRH
ncbi:hypothetical protein chiPu_0001608 [Chiloscyllium punctatum]|uniref:Uncharacterized protein n=1 Tax=Chiloscyllium punctatum TaxID=137246 RepID=A0A401RYH4_CHIPU|nr:hypothetical protein [Chiloscyllium punctatum]